jgi:hypothetical protein
VASMDLSVPSPGVPGDPGATFCSNILRHERGGGLVFAGSGWGRRPLSVILQFKGLTAIDVQP